MFKPYKPAIYRYFINLDERGEFHADVRNINDRTLFEIHGFDVFEDGWMRHKLDLLGLKNYLIHLGIMTPRQELATDNGR